MAGSWKFWNMLKEVKFSKQLSLNAKHLNVVKAANILTC